MSFIDRFQVEFEPGQRKMRIEWERERERERERSVCLDSVHLTPTILRRHRHSPRADHLHCSSHASHAALQCGGELQRFLHFWLSERERESWCSYSGLCTCLGMSSHARGLQRG